MMFRLGRGDRNHQAPQEKPKAPNEWRILKIRATEYKDPPPRGQEKAYPTPYTQVRVPIIKDPSGSEAKHLLKEAFLWWANELQHQICNLRDEREGRKKGGSYTLTPGEMDTIKLQATMGDAVCGHRGRYKEIAAQVGPDLILEVLLEISDERKYNREVRVLAGKNIIETYVNMKGNAYVKGLESELSRDAILELVKAAVRTGTPVEALVVKKGLKSESTM